MTRYILLIIVVLILSVIVFSWWRYNKQLRRKAQNFSPTDSNNTAAVTSENKTAMPNKIADKNIPEESNANSTAKPLRSQLISDMLVAAKNAMNLSPQKSAEEEYISLAGVSQNAQTLKSPAREPEQNNYHDLLAVTIEADKTKTFEGYNLLQTILATDLHYGENHLFHKYKDPYCKTVLFSLAASSDFKGFDLKDMRTLNCQELVLFMDPKATSEPKEVYNFMLAVAKQLSSGLGGKLTVKKHNSPAT